jgi:hypothetical protein
MDQLMASLLDLLHELERLDIPITVGGGFGLYLKRQHLTSTGQQTLFDQLPEPRSTNDLDLFLRVEVLADLGRTRVVAEAIRRLGYTAVEEAKFLQWKREVLVGGIPQEVKIEELERVALAAWRCMRAPPPAVVLRARYLAKYPGLSLQPQLETPCDDCKKRSESCQYPLNRRGLPKKWRSESLRPGHRSSTALALRSTATPGSSS